MITGADLSYEDLNRDAPLAVSEDEEAAINKVVPLDYETNLRWPAPMRVASWWDTRQQRFSSGMRYLAGERVDVASALRVLARGKQRQRVAAAIELALIDPEKVLFEVRARGRLQEALLLAWSSVGRPVR